MDNEEKLNANVSIIDPFFFSFLPHFTRYLALRAVEDEASLHASGGPCNIDGAFMDLIGYFVTTVVGCTVADVWYRQLVKIQKK